MQEINDQDFEARVLDNDKPVLVDFWAPWCGPCRTLAPTLEAIAQAREDVDIVKLNIDENPYTPAQYGVMSIPTMILFEASAPVHQIVGAQPKAQIEAQLDQVLSR